MENSASPIKNIKITDAKLCGECSTIQTSNFIHQTSDISVAAVPVPCHVKCEEADEEMLERVSRTLL